MVHEPGECDKQATVLTPTRRNLCCTTVTNSASRAAEDNQDMRKVVDVENDYDHQCHSYEDEEEDLALEQLFPLTSSTSSSYSASSFFPPSTITNQKQHQQQQPYQEHLMSSSMSKLEHIDSQLLFLLAGKQNVDDASTCCSTTCMEDSLASLKCTLIKPAAILPFEETFTSTSATAAIRNQPAAAVSRSSSVVIDPHKEQQQEQSPCVLTRRRRRKQHKRQRRLIDRSEVIVGAPVGGTGIKQTSMAIKALPRELEIAETTKLEEDDQQIEFATLKA